MKVIKTDKKFVRWLQYIALLLLYLLFITNIALANLTTTHSVLLKITNPNSTTSLTPVYDSDGASWTQVYIEIPAKLYMDKGWLDENLNNLRFIDLDSGNIELAHWVPETNTGTYRINNLGIWLLVKDLEPGETEKIRMEMVDGGQYYANPRSSDQTYDRSGYETAETVFPFYAIHSGDPKWTTSIDNGCTLADQNGCRVENATFLNNRLLSEDDMFSGDWKDDGNNATSQGPAITSNEFTITIHNLKFYNVNGGSSLLLYFLSQASELCDLDISPGYRLNFSDYISVSDNLHHNRYQFTIKLEEFQPTTLSWITKAQTTWQPYDNSRHIFDLKVSKDQIFVLFDGKQLEFTGVNGGTTTNGRYNRTDTLTTGRFGYDRGRWNLDNDGPDINEFLIRRFLDQEPSYEIYGNADLVLIDQEKGNVLGNNLNEIIPDTQRATTTVDGNSLNDYIFATYSIAKPEQIVDTYKIVLKNRSEEASETFTWHVQNNNPDKWMVYFCDDSGANCIANTPDDISLLPGYEKTYQLKFVPTPSALVNAGNAEITIGVEAQGDSSFDNVTVRTQTTGSLGCFWKYKAEELISWPGGNGYTDLLNYQVLIKLENEPKLNEARKNGSDIVITDGNGTLLDYWIKKFDPNNGTLEAWVKVPKIKGDGSETTVYLWWGNKYAETSRSSKKNTFDLWEDWESDYNLLQRVGCDDGTRTTTITSETGQDVSNLQTINASCSDQPIDTHGWKNLAYPSDFYNWWEIDNIGNTKVAQADAGSTHLNKVGPYLYNGNLGWDHYEVTYQIYTGTYYNYSNDSTWGNPEINPVFFNDAGNMWGVEYFEDKYILRPYAAGIDFSWSYQSLASALIGEPFPKRDSWYQAKVRVFKDHTTGTSHLKIFMSHPKGNPMDLPDPDYQDDFVKIADVDVPPAYNLKYGEIAFGGMSGGFGYDNIRVRKYVEDDTESEPKVTNSLITETQPQGGLILSTPQITAPIFGGRPVYIETQTVPFAWRGDLIAYYVDCYINGDCKYSNCTVCGGNETCPNVTADQCEYQDKLGTISVFGKIDDNTPKGVGYHLLKRTPGKFNSDISDDNRTILTTDGSGTILDFDLGKCSELQNYLGTSGSCNVTDNLTDETEKLILFVRGYYIDDERFSRSMSRNFDSYPVYGDQDGIPEPNEQWKIADVLHSNPLIVGIPNMVYGDLDYWDFVDENSKRPLVSYFMSNDGILHAIRLATVDQDGAYQVDPNAKELWAFIPHALLKKLKNSIDADHEYLADGLLRAIDIKSGGEWKTVLLGIGGRENLYIFAMDITDPEDPQLLWEMNDDPTGRIGTAISSPALGLVDINGDGSMDTWIAVIGSGYDQNYLNNYENKTAWLTILNLEDGEILKQLKVSDKVGNVLTSISALRDPQSGEIKKIYFGDYYGALWRITNERLARIDNAAPLAANATLTSEDMLFRPVDYGNATQPTAPKCPIIAFPRVAKGEATDEYWIYFGTGDYDEFDPNYSNQYFFGLKDIEGTQGPYELSDLQDVTNSTSTNPFAKSWYIKLGVNDDADYVNNPNQPTLSRKTSNERVLKTPEVYGGLVFFTTFEPLDMPCGGGKSRFYAVQYRTGLLREGFFVNFDENHKNVRSIELDSLGIPSQPLIFEGQTKTGETVAHGVVTFSEGETEKIQLNSAALSTALDILLWREKR